MVFQPYVHQMGFLRSVCNLISSLAGQSRDQDRKDGLDFLGPHDLTKSTKKRNNY